MREEGFDDSEVGVSNGTRYAESSGAFADDCRVASAGVGEDVLVKSADANYFETYVLGEYFCELSLGSVEVLAASVET